jgi:hypothetical protein
MSALGKGMVVGVQSINIGYPGITIEEGVASDSPVNNSSTLLVVLEMILVHYRVVPAGVLEAIVGGFFGVVTIEK